MKLPGRQILDVLDKPLNLVTKFVSSLVGGRSSGSNGGRHSPSPSTHSPITSNPLVPAFLLLTVGLLLATVTPLGPWLAAAQDSPTLRAIFLFPGKKQTNGLPKAAEAISVWTKKQAGFYYCEGGTLFGKKPGQMMTQSDALMSGFRPFGGKYCTNNQPLVASADNSHAGSQPPPASRVGSTNGKETLGRPSKQRSKPSMAIESGSVWAMKVFGTYYCQGDVLFGTKPGKLMTQSDALKAGYKPAVTRCNNGNPDQAATGYQSLGSQQPGASQANSMLAKELLAQIPQEDGEPPKAGKGVSVWVIKELGFYYCRGDVLFGHKPGVFMTQSDALAAGYQPSDVPCTIDNSKQTSAGRLTSQIMHGRR